MTTTQQFNILDHGKTIHVYKNGDFHFTPRKFVINKRNRSYEKFLDDVGRTVKPPTGFVRRLCTPENGHIVHQLDDIVSGCRYVAVGNERFKKIGYNAIPEGGIFRKQEQTPPKEIKPVVHSRLKTSGRIRKIRNDPVTIFIYANGEILKNAVRVLFKKRELQSWDTALAAIMDRLTLRTGAVRWLYSLDGSLVEDLSLLKNAEFYIGVGTERFYKELLPQYGQHPALQMSPRSERRKFLPPLPKPRRAKRRSNPSDNSSSLDNSMDSNKSKRRHRKGEVEEEGVFHAKPVKHKRSSEKSRPPVDYDKDEGGIYKSKNDNRETRGAAEVEENKDTRTDLPIDQVPAEEVKDEVDENENKRKSKDHNKAKKPETPTKAKSPTDQPKSPANEPEKKTSTPNDEHAAGDHQPSEDRSRTPQQQTGAGDAAPQEAPKDEAQTDQNPRGERENEAATTIQAGYRGYQTRKDLKDKQQHATPAEGASEPT